MNLFPECLAFDDVLLKPVMSNGRSRLDPELDTSTYIGSLELGIPMISSPMDTVTEEVMAFELGMHGGMGVLHRFMSVEQQIDKICNLADKRKKANVWFPIVPAVGVGKSGQEWVKSIFNSRAMEHIDMLSIDIANGHSIVMKEMILFIRNELKWDIDLMVGNVATREGFSYLADLDIDAVRVGIGGGSICKTRIQTGFGMPTFSSILECYDEKISKGYGHVSIIADGGIRYPQDMVKSLVAGADAVMCGGIFAGTKEAPGEIITDAHNVKYKKYRGMASEEVQIDLRGGLKPGTCAEGVATQVLYKGSLKRVLADFTGGLRSAFTYANAKNIRSLRNHSKFIRITESGQIESHAYGTRI